MTGKIGPTRGTQQKVPALATTAAVLGTRAGEKWNGERPHILPKWRKQYRRLLELRTRVEAERRDYAQAASQPLEVSSLDVAGAATQDFERDLAWSESLTKQELLYEIDAALQRLENGTYGICELSGKSIPPERLNVLPWTRFTREVEQQLERDGTIRPLRLGQLREINS